MKFKKIVWLVFAATLFSFLSIFVSAKEEYTVSVSAECGIVSGGGEYAEDTEATLVAVPFSGYHFIGWYKGSANLPESMKLTYKITVKEDVAYKAKFVANDTSVPVSIQLGGGKVVYTVNSKENTLNSSVENVLFPQGTRIIFTALANDGYSFLYWRDQNSGKIISQEENVELVLGSAVRLQAAFVKTTAKYAVFIDKGNVVLKAGGPILGKDVTAPEDLPVYQGYVFTGWDRSFENLSGIAVIKAKYEKENKKYTVNVEGGYLNQMNVTSGEFAFDTPVCVAASVPEGKYFNGWSYDGGKTIASYSRVYSFLVGENVTLTAVFSDVSAEQRPIVSITSIVRRKLESGLHRITVMSQWDVPNGYKFVETGFIRTTESTYGSALALSAVNGTTVMSVKSAADTQIGQYMLHINLTDSSKSSYVRAYLTYINESTGKVHTVYSASKTKGPQDLI